MYPVTAQKVIFDVDDTTGEAAHHTGNSVTTVEQVSDGYDSESLADTNEQVRALVLSNRILISKQVSKLSDHVQFQGTTYCQLTTPFSSRQVHQSRYQKDSGWSLVLGLSVSAFVFLILDYPD